MANVGTFMPLGKLLVELMSQKEDNVPQHVSEAHLACHFTNLWIINFYYTKVAAVQKSIYFLAELMLDWILAYLKMASTLGPMRISG